MKILRPNRVVKSAIFSLAFLSLFFFNSCKKLIDSVDAANIPGAASGGNRSILAPETITATQGAKQKITISWSVVTGAAYYHIYYAYNANDEFIKLDETDKNFYDDKVDAGATIYYKIKAEKTDGSLSDFSKIARGTSLSVPVISGAEFEENTATIYWYMQNSVDERTGEDIYANNLRFTVFCVDAKNKENVIEEKHLDGHEESYTFKGLSSNSSYLYYISACLIIDQNATEESPRVEASTLLAYTPQAPEFTASEGTSSTGITLDITLPQKVQLSTKTTESPNAEVVVSYPLYFEIQRKIEGQDDDEFDTVVEHLYYNGDTTAPTTAYYKDPTTQYNPGDTIKWTDEDSKLKRGQKYVYRIRSYTDVNYSDVVGSTDKTPKKPGKWSARIIDGTQYEICGWICAKPIFECVNDKNNYEEIDNRITKMWFGFEASWDAMGKESDYNFAIEQIREDILDGTKPKVYSWVEINDSDLFSSLDDIKNSDKTTKKDLITFENINEDNEGYYYYTLYIIPKTYKTADEGKEHALDSVAALRYQTIASSKKKTDAEITEITGGYKDKIIIKYATDDNQDNYGHYKFIRIDDKNNSVEISESEVEDSSQKRGEFTDKNVSPGVTYKYTMISRVEKIEIASEEKVATTLGIPEPKFNAKNPSYDKITVTMAKVPAATRYTATLGTKTCDFTDAGCDFTKDNGVEVDDGFKVTYNDTTKEFTIEIQRPTGYNDAKTAGNDIDFRVTAKSDSKSIVTGDTANDSEVKKTRVLGPAKINAAVGTFADATEDSISVSWDEVEGAKGYLIHRVRYNDTAMKDAGTEYGEATDTYYYYIDSTDKNKIEDVDKSMATVSQSGNRYTLTDKYYDGEVDAIDSYQQNQAKIAWGLPYRYCVLPVLKNGDFELNEKFVITKGVQYKNLEDDNAKIVTGGVATFGYGLRVDAEKAKSTKEQEIKWTPPFYGDEEDLSPVLYKRAFNKGNRTNAWTRVTQNTDDNTSYKYSPEEIYTALEYAVKYVKQNVTENEVLSPYFVSEYLEKTKEDDLKTTENTNGYEYSDNDEIEPLNKGYLLTVKYSAVYGGTSDDAEGTTKSENYYSEICSLDAWDYTERVLGPTKYEINILNYNLKDGWTKVAELDDKLAVTPVTGLKDTTVVKAGNGVRLTPTGISTGVDNEGTDDIDEAKETNGVLKVLRDAKHYYSVTIYNKFVTTNNMFTNDLKTYAYRQITDEELVKAMTLVLANALELSNVKTENSISVSGATGGFSWSAPTGSFNSNNDFHWNISDYVHNWTSSPGTSDTIISFMKIKDTQGGVRGYKGHKIAGIGDTKLVQLSTSSSKNLGETFQISVSGYNVTLSSYTATVNFKQSDSALYASVQRTGDTTATKVADVSSKKDVRKWSPIRIGDTNTFYGGDDDNGKDNGWWPK